MKPGKRQGLKLKTALTAAYHEKEKAEVSESWHINTMNHIRRLGPLNSKSGYFVDFGHLVWRIAPVACALAVVFAVCLFNLDFTREYEMAELFLEDPIEYTFVQSFSM